MMDRDLIREYYEGALYALAVGTPLEVIQYGEIVYAEDDNFEGAQGFKMALEVYHTEHNCRVILPDGITAGAGDLEIELNNLFNDEEE